MIMINQKVLIIFFSSIFILFILIHYNLKNPPTLPIKLIPYPTTYLSQTCINSSNIHLLRKSRFHISMVHFKIPNALAFWVENRIGFEIGAPSISTWGNLGIYDAAKVLDTSNYANNSIWESGIKDGSSFIWKNQTKGKRYIRDGVDLYGIPNDYYDFVCAADVLEHIANPLKALLEWLRIMRSGGLLIIIVPFKNVTFDHKRDVVRLEHLIDDYHNQINETDLSHLDEILRLHDIERDGAAGGIQAFKERSKKNFQNRGLHQHVYDQEFLYYLYLCLNLDVKIQFIWEYHNLIIGQKP